MTSTPALPTLQFSFTIVAEVDPGLPIDRRTDESLEIIPITGGRVTGAISGEVQPGGADWCLYRNDGAFNVEARYWIRTDDGDIVDVVNVGRISPGSSPDAVDGLFMSTPQFRTTAPALQWLTQRVFVGRAEAFGTHTTIDVFEVVS